MDTNLLIAIITVCGTIFVAIITPSISSYFNKKQQIYAEWRSNKLNHYRVLLSSLSDLAVDGTDKNEANRNFSLAVNTIALVAPQYVITELMGFHDAVKFSNPNKTAKEHDRCLIKLLIAIRRDLGLKDCLSTFNFHLIGSAPGDG